MKRNIFLTALLLFLCWSAQAEVYKWVDENGKVHFGDRAPDDKKAESLDEKLKDINIDHASGDAKPSVVVNTEKTQDEKNLEAQKKKKMEQAIGARCKKWKQDIAAIGRGDRGRFLDENGNEEVVLEKDRGKKLAEWRSNYLRSNCQALYPLED
ncbi:MAG TPA: DUF4124 domain-containing protein [Pseudomonadales bacterium]|nr:DUF4124 domain-containing protein [Pseudomonadales bacterium]HNN86349.1 DUF4124 domain-containing protein [Pseudomonadales bacterium]